MIFVWENPDMEDDVDFCPRGLELAPLYWGTLLVLTNIYALFGRWPFPGWRCPLAPSECPQ